MDGDQIIIIIIIIVHGGMLLVTTWMLFVAACGLPKIVQGFGIATAKRFHSATTLRRLMLPMALEEALDMPSFWENHPFAGAEYLVTRFLDGNTPEVRIASSSDAPLPNRSVNSSSSSKEDGDNADVFDQLYGQETNTPCLPIRPTDRNGCPSQDPPWDGPNPRLTYALTVAYHGGSFRGWQWQPPQNTAKTGDKTDDSSIPPTVQAVVERDLQNVLGGPKPVYARVAGRTDAGVHAVGQVVSFHTRQANLPLLPLGDAASRVDLDENPNDKLDWIYRVGQSAQRTSANEQGNNDDRPAIAIRSVRHVSNKFHPTFDATGRSYAYVLDWDHLARHFELLCTTTDHDDNNNNNDMDAVQRFASHLQAQLQPLEQQSLDYIGLSYGKKAREKDTFCTLSRARVVVLEIPAPATNEQKPKLAVVIELTANRFLRRMVRKLVAAALVFGLQSSSSISAALVDQSEAANAPRNLLELVQAQDRSLAARSARPQGLIFVGAHYD